MTKVSGEKVHSTLAEWESQTITRLRSNSIGYYKAWVLSERALEKVLWSWSSTRRSLEIPPPYPETGEADEEQTIQFICLYQSMYLIFQTLPMHCPTPTLSEKP